MPEGADLVAQIKELAELRLQGVLDENEFTIAKAKLLSTDAAPPQDVSEIPVECESEVPAPLIIAAAPSEVAAVRTQAATISAAHIVKHHAALREFLVDKQLDGLLSHLALATVAGDGESGWYAEHARAQLNPESGCESTPAWVARLVSSEANANEHDGIPTRLFLWASDQAAVRRALLALQLERNGRSVAICAWGVPKTAYAAQVQRWAYEHDDYEMVLPTEGAAASDSTFVATLRAAHGSALEALHQDRAASSDADLEEAKGVLEALSRRLLAGDPQCMIKVARGTSRPGIWLIEQLRYKGHMMEIALEVDKHASVDALEKLATTSCLCCSGDDSPWPEVKRRTAQPG
jgi:hypothetical protein